MMLCTPYRCAQERKNIRRQLCSWSGKALGLVGLEEVLVGLDAAYFGRSSEDKLPFTEVRSVLSKAVDYVENDNNVCGVCGKPRKAPVRKLSYPKTMYPSPSDVIDLTMIATAAATGDQPIDLSKGSRLYSSPSALASDLPVSLLRTPNGISSPVKASVAAKRQRVGIGNMSLQRDILQLGNSLDPSILQLVNNWSKIQPQQHRSHSPTASPNNAYEPFSLSNHDISGPTNTAAGVHSGLAANRPHNHHHNRTSAAATAGSLQRTANNNAGDSTGAHFTGEPSDISSSTLSDQDAVNRFKQWRVASWVRDAANRHEREGSAVAVEDHVQDLHVDNSASRLARTNPGAAAANNSNPSNPTRSSPPISNVLRNVPVTDNNAAKSALRKRVAQVPPQPQQPPKQRHSTPPPPTPSSLNQQKSTGLDSASKRPRTDQPQQQQTSATANNNASLNNLASVLSSLFPSVSTPAATQAATSSSLLPGGSSPTDLDALLTLALQNWPSASNAAAATQHSDPTAALLTAAYQQQMQQAALLQLQYASIFSNPLLYSNLLLGGGTGASATSTANNLNLSSLANALGSASSSSTNVDAMLAEALLAMLGSGSSTNLPVLNTSSVTTTAATPSTNKVSGQQHHSSHSHRHGNSSAAPNRVVPSTNKASAGLNAQQNQPVPETDATHNASPTEAVILNLEGRKHKLDSNKSVSPQQPVTPTGTATVSLHLGAIASNESATIQDLSVRPSLKQEVIHNGADGKEVVEELPETEFHECQNGKEKDEVEIPGIPEFKQIPAKQPCLVIANGEGGDEELNESSSHHLNNGKSSLADENNVSNQDISQDSHSSAHLEEEQSSRSPVPAATHNGKAAEIIDLQTTV